MNCTTKRIGFGLLSSLLCLGACASSKRVSDLIAPAEGVRVVLIQPARGPGKDLRLALVNQSEDPRVKSSYRASEIKEINDKLMGALVTTLENEGYMRHASRGRPAHMGRRLSVHLDEGSYHLSYESDKKLYHRCLEIFMAIWNNTVRPIGSGDSLGRRPIDFLEQQRRIQRLNAERAKRAGVHR